MPKKLGELLYNAAIKSGISSDHAGLKPLLALTSDVDEEVANALDELMSFQSAQNNVKLKNHFLSSSLDGFDKKLLARAKAEQLPDEDIAAITAEPNTFKKSELLMDKIASKKEAAAKARKDGDPEAEKVLKEQIKKLNEDLVKVREEFTTKESTLKKTHENERMNDIIERTFMGFDWSKAYDKADQPILARAALNAKLDEMGAIIVRDEKGKLKLVQAKNPELDYFDNKNQSITFEKLADSIMADKKYIAVNPDASKEGEQGRTIQGQSSKEGDQSAKNHTTTRSLLDEAMHKHEQDFIASQKK
jgi:hypothetical protein